jgi:hypothetical protein
MSRRKRRALPHVEPLPCYSLPNCADARCMLHAAGNFQQLANSVYSAFDFMGDRLRALELWEPGLLEIVQDRKPTGLQWT